jgi:uncharacterized protein (TIGR01777 family)
MGGIMGARSMRIVIAGGSGFLGLPLARALEQDGHDIVILSRSAAAKSAGSQVMWTPDGAAGPWASAVAGAGAVVNLAGEPIAAKRWTSAQKQRILESRRLATRSLVQAVQNASQPPAVFVSGSAVGYYGPSDDTILTEDAAAGNDFLAQVCVEWEAEAMRAATRTRVVCIRTGLVLERDGGALAKMLPPFWLGAGGPIGSGQQWWPWIHRRDWIDLVRWSIVNNNVSGPVNATAPTPTVNATFARALGRALHRPAVLPTPGFALKLVLGEMAETVLLSGQRAVPEKAQRLGFRFTYADLDVALAAIFSRS